MTIQKAVEVLNYSALADRYAPEFTEAINVVTAFFEIMGVTSFVYPPPFVLGTLSSLESSPDAAAF